MPIYVQLTTSTDEASKKGKDLLIQGSEKEVNANLERLGVKVLFQYMLLGPYDFINVLEAPSDVGVLKEAVEVRSRGNNRTLTMPAVTISELKEIMKS